jgi:hypothetical protein
MINQLYRPAANSNSRHPIKHRATRVTKKMGFQKARGYAALILLSFW